MAKSFGVFLFILLSSIAVTVFIKQTPAVPVKATADVAIPTPTPEVQEVHSSKGDKKLIAMVTGLTYDFFVADLSGSNRRMIYSKTVSAGITMAAPINAWDPTDTYVYIGEKASGIPDYYVLKASGELFADGQKFIDVGAVWAAKKIGYSIREATGWASGTLLILYTSKDDGSRGPAFWFEIPSTAILQLAA